MLSWYVFDLKFIFYFALFFFLSEKRKKRILFLFQHRRVNTAFYPEVLSGNRKLIEETIGRMVEGANCEDVC